MEDEQQFHWHYCHICKWYYSTHGQKCIWGHLLEAESAEEQMQEKLIQLWQQWYEASGDKCLPSVPADSLYLLS